MISIYKFNVCFLLLYAFQLLNISLYAGNDVFIKGKVFDNKTNEPLLGVNVIFGINIGTITDNYGNYTFKTETGYIDITFSFIGYKSLTKSLNINSNDTIVLNVGMTMSINELEEIVVSANKTEQKISDLTVSMNVIKPEIITKTHTTTAEEIVNKTPGIEIMDGQASIRGGSGYSYGAGSRVLALVDGLPVLSADAGNIKWHFFSLENLSQLEIIKGASSVLYGSSALNGIINLRTIDATTKPLTKFSILGGVYDKPQNENWIWWESPCFFSGISFFHAIRRGNTGMNVGASVNIDQGYRRLNDKKYGRLNFKLKHYNNNIEGLTYGIGFNSVYIEKKDFILWENADSGALKQDESTAIELNSLLFTVDPFIRFKKNDHQEHELLMRFQTTLQEYPENSQNNSDSYSFYSEYKLLYKMFNNLDYTMGIVQNYSRIISVFYNNHYSLNLAGYIQLNYNPVKRIKFISGIRLEQNTLNGEQDKLVPILRTGINVQAAEYSFLRVSFGQGYRYPSIAEKFAYTELGSVKILPNPELKSETGWNGELGVKQGIKIGSFHGQLDFSLFYLNNNNLIEYDFGLFTDPYSQEFTLGFKARNTENARVYGNEIEFMVSKKFGEITSTLNGGYTFMYPVEYNDKKSEVIFLKYRSHHSAKLFMNFTFRKFELVTDAIYKSKILSIDNVFTNTITRENILPGFYSYWQKNNNGFIVFDGQLSYILFKELRLSLAVKNIFNTEYVGRPGDIQPHRSYSLQLSGKF